MSPDVHLTVARDRWRGRPKTAAHPGHARGSSSAPLPGDTNQTVETPSPGDTPTWGLRRGFKDNKPFSSTYGDLTSP